MQMRIEREDYTIISGYDRMLNYVFMTVVKDNEMVYSNLNDTNGIGLKDFTYFEEVAREKFNLDLEHLTFVMNCISMVNNKTNDELVSIFIEHCIQEDIVHSFMQSY